MISESRIMYSTADIDAPADHEIQVFVMFPLGKTVVNCYADVRSEVQLLYSYLIGTGHTWPYCWPRITGRQVNQVSLITSCHDTESRVHKRSHPPALHNTLANTFALILLIRNMIIHSTSQCLS